MTMPAEYASGDAVYATVALADLSGLPIEIERLHCSLIRSSLSLVETSMAVDELVAQGRLVSQDDQVCLAGRHHVFANQVDATERASEIWPLVEKWAKSVGRIPFVRMVAVTGGLAVDALLPDEPVEFFIVVRPRRLWTTRLLITRALRAASRDGVDIVPAYITTTRSPEIEHRSAPMACELAQLVVIVGESVSRTLRRSNDWMFEWLPNATIDGNKQHLIEQVPSSTQKWTEAALLLPPFRVVENWTRRRQIAQLRKLTKVKQAARPRDRPRFSTETCDEHLGVRMATTEQAWKAALTSE